MWGPCVTAGSCVFSLVVCTGIDVGIGVGVGVGALGGAGSWVAAGVGS